MAKNKLIIGSLPVMRGAYDSAISYYRDNQVTMYGSTFQSLTDDNVGFPPAELREDGKVYAINTDKWIITANAIEAYNTGARTTNVETRVDELGQYEENAEFVRVCTDNEGKVLFGITVEGEPYFPKNKMYSVESNQEFLAVWLDGDGKMLFGLRQDGSTYVAKADFIEKVEKIQQLLDENGIGDGELRQRVGVLEENVTGLQETFPHQENAEFAYVVTDNEGKILFGIKSDGSPYYPNNEMYHVIQNEEWMAAWLDADNKILFGIKHDGSTYIGKSELADAVKEIQEKLPSVTEVTDNFQVTDNPEFMSVTTDSEGKILEGVQADGKKYFPSQEMLEKYDDVEGRTEITLDAENKILAYRDKDGVRHENKLDVDEIYQNGDKVGNIASKNDIKDFVTKEDVINTNISEFEGVSDHNTPNLLIVYEMQKTFNDGTNSFTPPNDGYEMSNPIKCKAGDWFTRTGTATGMVVVTDENDTNGQRLFNADGTTLPNTFQIPTDMTWVRYIRMAANVVGAQDGSVVICKGKEAYTSENRGDYLTIDKLRLQSANIPKEIKYLKSSDGTYWELYVNDDYQLQIREVDPNIITELPADFPVYTISGDYGNYFDKWISFHLPYLMERNKNGVLKYYKATKDQTSYADFKKVENSSGKIRYMKAYTEGYTGPNGEKLLTIYDEDFNIVETNIGGQNGKDIDPHDYVYFDDNHVATFGHENGTINVPVDSDGSGYVEANFDSILNYWAYILEWKKID